MVDPCKKSDDGSCLQLLELGGEGWEETKKVEQGKQKETKREKKSWWNLGEMEQHVKRGGGDGGL